MGKAIVCTQSVVCPACQEVPITEHVKAEVKTYFWKKACKININKHRFIILLVFIHASFVTSTVCIRHRCGVLVIMTLSASQGRVQDLPGGGPRRARGAGAYSGRPGTSPGGGQGALPPEAES